MLHAARRSHRDPKSHSRNLREHQLSHPFFKDRVETESRQREMRSKFFS